MRAGAPPALGRAFRAVFGRIEGADHRRRRLLALVQGGVTAFGSRLVGMAVSFVSVPLTIGYLGPDRYGVWVTLGSLIAWMSLADFGLGNGLTNALTAAMGRDRPDLVRTHLSDGVVLLALTAAAVAALAALVWPLVDWAALFGARSPALGREVGGAAAATLAVFLLRFPLGTAGRLLVAAGEGRVANGWGCASNVLSLGALVLVTRLQGGLVWLVVAVSGTPLLVDLALNLWLYGRHRPALRPALAAVRPREFPALYRVGGQFFALQIMALVTLSTDNFVVGHFLGSGDVPAYSLTYNLFGYAGLPQAVLFPYLWAAYGEAIARRDVAWVARTLDLNLLAGLAFTGAAALALVLVGRPFVLWWTGGAVAPSTPLLLWMAAWSLINSFTNPIACLLAAAGRMRWQIGYSALSTAANLALSVALVRTHGREGVIAATVLAYAVFVCGPTFVDVRLLLRGLRATHPEPPGGEAAAAAVLP